MGSEAYADPPAWNFPVQACDSNYITLKHIQITDTLVAKFRKVPNATPQHGTFKTPGQASPNPSNFGDTWKYLCSIIVEDKMAYLYGILIMEHQFRVSDCNNGFIRQ